MLSDYTFNRYKDTYQLGNLDLINSLGYSVSRLTNCSSYVVQFAGILPKNTPLFILPIIYDGEYQITLTRGSDSIVIAIKNYLALQNALISNLKQFICGDKACINCDEQGLDDCVNYQGIYGQIIAYQYIVKPYSPDYCVAGDLVDSYLHQAMDLNKCQTTNEIYAQLTSESMLGRITNSKELVRYFAIIYYLVFYQYERKIAVDDTEKAYIDSKYYWTQIQGCIQSGGVSLSDLQNIFNNLISTIPNTAPTVGNVSKNFVFISGTQTYTFSQLDFTTNFADINGDHPGTVMILNNVFTGQLYFNGLLINGEGFTFAIADANKLQYKYTLTETNVIYDKIFFQISDDNINPKYSNMATISITTAAYVNQPPDAVGNNTVAITNRVNRVFTLADFTTNTTPPYHDPEGDGIYQLRIDSLPTLGTLKVSGSAATVGQIIAASLIVSGGFEYDAPNQDAAATVSFNFSLADTGSHTFVS